MSNYKQIVLKPYNEMTCSDWKSWSKNKHLMNSEIFQDMQSKS